MMSRRLDGGSSKAAACQAGDAWAEATARPVPEHGDGTLNFDPVVELAENANTYVPLVRGAERVTTDRYVIWFGQGQAPGWTVAQRFRFDADELDEVIDEIHEHVREHGRTACSWEVGSSARPENLVELLHERGLYDDPT